MSDKNNKIYNLHGQMGIREAADFLHISIDTLRRLDSSGILKSNRIKSGGHRYYNEFDLEIYLLKNLVTYAEKWARSKKFYNPNKIFYCPDSSVFQGRLYKLLADLQKLNDKFLDYSLLMSSVGEIGDNTFGHNLGNFPDVKGLLFGYNLEDRFIILADRGRGVLETLHKVRPSLKDDAEALKVAFTEIISGRAPENRGNGLKWVRENLEKFPWSLSFRSGDAELIITKTDKIFKIKKAKYPFRGCLAIINF